VPPALRAGAAIVELALALAVSQRWVADRQFARRRTKAQVRINHASAKRGG
jgi:hypothetical protein